MCVGSYRSWVRGLGLHTGCLRAWLEPDARPPGWRPAPSGPPIRAPHRLDTPSAFPGRFIQPGVLWEGRLKLLFRTLPLEENER